MSEDKARNLCRPPLGRYLGRTIGFSFCGAPTLRGSETDGPPQSTAENEMATMRKQVTLERNKGARAPRRAVAGESMPPRGVS